MNTTIWKFELDTVGKVEMPIGAEPLTVQMQNDKPCLWAMVDPEAAKETRQFNIFGTGHKLPVGNLLTKLKYIATFQMYGGTLVFHVFEEIKITG